MTRDEKITHLTEYLTGRGVKMARRTAAPPLWRMFWRLGLKTPPPLFLSFDRLLFVFLLSFLVAFAFGPLTAWLCLRRPRFATLITLLTLANVLLAGLWLAAYFRLMARRLALPPWEQYPEGLATPSRPRPADEAAS